MKARTIWNLSIKNIEQAYYKLTGQTDRIVPYKVVVELTNQCNSRCKTCDIWKIKKENIQKIDLTQFELFLKKMDKHLLWLALTGGEITSYNQFPEAIQLIKRYAHNLSILTFTTNGLLPQRILEYALLMKNEIACDIFITISLDGDEHTHDTLRGVKGNYTKCMETYDLLRKNNIDCHFGITVSEDNYNFIKNAYATYRDKIKAVTLFHTGGIFRNTQEENKSADAKIAEALTVIYKNYKVSSLGEWLIKFYLKIGVRFMRKERSTNIIPCDVGLSSAHLMANGDLLPCMYLPPIKKLSEGFELQDFHSKEATDILDDIKKDKCPHCWMSCYGPHSMLQAPVKTAAALLKPIT